LIMRTGGLTGGLGSLISAFRADYVQVFKCGWGVWVCLKVRRGGPRGGGTRVL